MNGLFFSFSRFITSHYDYIKKQPEKVAFARMVIFFARMAT